MERIQFRSINNSILIPQKHALAVVKGVHDHGARVAEFDLEDRVVVLAPPFLAGRGVVLAQLEEVSEDGDCAGDFGDAGDVRDVGAVEDLRRC